MKPKTSLALLILPLLVSSCVPVSNLTILFALPGVVTQADGTLTLSGSIGLNSADGVIAALPREAKVALNLRGGEVSEAMRIADHITAQNIQLTVRGKCASSCANYIAGASSHLTIEVGGAISFHGGRINGFPKQLTACGGVYRCSDTQLKNIDTTLYREVEFMKLHHFNLELLALSGEITRDRRELWVPNLSELACYGIQVDSAPADYPPREKDFWRTEDLSLELQNKISLLCPES